MSEKMGAPITSIRLKRRFFWLLYALYSVSFLYWQRVQAGEFWWSGNRCCFMLRVASFYGVAACVKASSWFIGAPIFSRSGKGANIFCAKKFWAPCTATGCGSRNWPSLCIKRPSFCFYRPMSFFSGCSLKETRYRVSGSYSCSKFTARMLGFTLS